MLIHSYTHRVHICITSHNVFQVRYTCVSFYRLASYSARNIRYLSIGTAQHNIVTLRLDKYHTYPNAR